MELLSLGGARSLWFIDPSDLNPRGKNLFPQMIDWLKEMYGFSKVPANQNDLDSTKGLAFTGGKFETRAGHSISVGLTFYNDGFKAETLSSTDDADEFLLEALTVASITHGLNFEESKIRKKIYQSQLNVRCKRPLALINPKVAEFCDKIAEVRNPLVAPLKFEFSGVRFWDEKSVVNRTSEAISDFRFERKLGFAFDENRYYSTAPFETDPHFELLQQLERILLQ